ncbi:[protein-PII] uridylyltransferase [Alkalimarinus coralli]|uniref:[protein-PII] uridylyltransferase n=1 Tax=Alkalimarinus coralli TaxID=2935863 RepID=UPI00202ADF88|nr:[protein-PII] uridylyltransferase [Alkalimarinus coralli]
MIANSPIIEAFRESDELSLERLKLTIKSATAPAIAARNALKKASEQLDSFFMSDHDIKQIVEARAWFVDQILRFLWEQFDWKGKDNISLIAVGGYGRGELHPHSDIDILILAQAEIGPQYAEAITDFVTLLWDLKLDIGHSVRTIDECIESASQDITIATNLLESRTIAGNDILRELLSTRAYSDEVCSDRAYFIAKKEEQRLRHEKYSDTEYNLEPNLKSSPGTLRDIQTIGWITKRHFGLSCTSELTRYEFLTNEEYQMLVDGERFLWKMRYGLQIIANRNENRLLFDHQRKLTSMLGFEDSEKKLGVEIMMQQYYRVVLGLAELTDVILQHFDEAILRSNEQEVVHPLNKRFQLKNQYIEAVNNQIFAYAPYAIMEIFLLIAQNPHIKGIRATTIRALRAHRHLIDKSFRRDIAVTSLFMELMRTPHDFHRTLSFMKRYNVLGRYLPEFGKIIGQMQHDLFHAYTVDAHTIRVIKNMVNLRETSARAKYPLASRLIHRLPKLELLYIAGLYHDIAKGRGGNHSDLGSIDAQKFCQRHHLSTRDTQLVCWLVENHLLMSMTAQKKDIQDPDIIHSFAVEVPSQVHLDYLYVLTVADIDATNPILWNTWRASLLRQLYLEARRALRRGIENPLDKDKWISATQAEVQDILHDQGISSRQIDAIWNTLEDDYFLQDSTMEIAWQTSSIINHGESEEPLILIKDIEDHQGEGYTQIMIYLRNGTGLFAATTAVLEQLNLNIVSARINSGKGPCSLSTFVVLDELNQSLARDPERKAKVHHRLLDELDDADDYPEIIQRRTPRQLKHFSFPTEVTFSNDMINQRTVMEVITPDRPGLLARIGCILVENNVALVNAKIATLGERVEDVFFITDDGGQPISDPMLCEKLQKDICEQLDEHVQAS